MARLSAAWPNLWHLYAFQTMLQAGNLTVAASELRLSQPALSQALVGLETYFAAPLATRNHGRILATPEGDILSVRAARAIAMISDGLREAANLSPRRSITLIRLISSARLASLVAIVRHGGFAEAARATGVASPTLHRAARDLESAISVDLFEPTSYGVKPSRKAETLARFAALAFSEIRQAKSEIDIATGKASGHTVIGAMPLARSFVVPAAVEAFSRNNPGHRVTIVEGAYQDLLSGLQRGDIDFLVGALREDLSLKDVTQKALFADPLAVIMRVNHPAAKQKKLTKTIMTQFPWVAPRMESPLRAHFEGLFSPGEPPSDIIECNSLGAARVILMNSDRLMLLSDSQIRYEHDAGMLLSRTPPGIKRIRTIGITARKSWRPTTSQLRLLSILDDTANTL